MPRSGRTTMLPSTVPPRVCGACGGDLTGRPLNEPCKDCGWEPDVRCVACGYELRGLNESGVCPECATPVATSLRGDGLAHASPEYLRTLGRGLHLIRWGTGLLVLCWAAGAITLGVLLPSLPSWSVTIVARAILIVPACLYAYGWWQATRPDPRLNPDSLPKASMIARWTAVAMPTVLLLIAVVESILPQAVSSAARLVVVVSLMANLVSASMWLHWLSRRVPNRKAVRSASQARSASIVFACGWVVVDTTRITGWSLPAGSRWAFLDPLISIVAIVAAIFAFTRMTGVAGLIRDDVKRFLIGSRDLSLRPTVSPETD